MLYLYFLKFNLTYLYSVKVISQYHFMVNTFYHWHLVGLQDKINHY